VSLLARVYAAETDTASLAEFVFKMTAVPWVRVYDGRPESALTRTVDRPTEKLAGARILLLGCGGLGAPIAEHCARAGVNATYLRRIRFDEGVTRGFAVFWRRGRAPGKGLGVESVPFSRSPCAFYSA